MYSRQDNDYQRILKFLYILKLILTTENPPTRIREKTKKITPPLMVPLKILIFRI